MIIACTKRLLHTSYTIYIQTLNSLVWAILKKKNLLIREAVLGAYMYKIKKKYSNNCFYFSFDYLPLVLLKSVNFFSTL